MPPAFVFVGIIWRDVLFATTWLLATAIANTQARDIDLEVEPAPQAAELLPVEEVGRGAAAVQEGHVAELAAVQEDDQPFSEV